jgi:branched-subunit amino acid transport protein
MRVDPGFLILLVAMGLVTYIPRWFPLLFLSRKQLPSWLEAWLDFIPAAILSALILPELVTVGSPRHLAFFRPELIVAFPTLLFALKTRSLGGTVVLGMALFWLAGKFY